MLNTPLAQLRRRLRSLLAATLLVGTAGCAAEDAAWLGVVQPLEYAGQIGSDTRLSDVRTDGFAAYGAEEATVAYDSLNNQFFIAWEADDNDCYGNAFAPNNELELWGQWVSGTVGGEIGINDLCLTYWGTAVDPSDDARRPELVYNPMGDRYLLVFTASDSSGGDDIFGLFRTDWNGPMSATFRVSSMSGTGFDPKVAHDTALDQYLVVWVGDDSVIGEREAFGQLLSATGASIGGDFRISTVGPNADTTRDVLDVDVAYNATDAEYLVVFSGDDNVDGEFEIFGQRLSAAGAEIGADDFPISDVGPPGDVNYDGYDPRVAWDSLRNQYLVIYRADDPPLQQSEWEIFGQRLDGAGNEIGTNDFRISTHGADGDNRSADFQPPDLLYNPDLDEFYVVWGGDALGDSEVEIFHQRVLPDGLLYGNAIQLSSTGPVGNNAYWARTPAVAYNSFDDRYFTVWHGDDDSGALVDNELEIYGQLWEVSATTDSDSDGVPDLSDVCRGYDDTNDADSDTIPDDCDVCALGDDRLDFDADGVPNACDICAGGNDNDDADADGVPDGCDACPGFDDSQDADGDGTPDGCDQCPGSPDVDTDMDGTLDCDDGCPMDSNKTAAGVCGCGVADTDTDSDGTPDCNDGCPMDINKTAPGLCDCGTPDTDTDSDGTADCNDDCPMDINKVLVGQCGCGMPDTDTDTDGTADCIDGCPMDINKTATGQCGCGMSDTDTDSDGTADCNDGCPMDVNKTATGQCGCGMPDTDSDSDGTANCNDACPGDANKTAGGQCGCGMPDTDSDSDGTADCVDGCAMDANKIAAGQCGCGNPDTDGDSDGTVDCLDGCPTDGNKVAAGTCGCNEVDTDTDADGTADCDDDCPADAGKIEPGTCGCGVADTDTDADGTLDCDDGCPNHPTEVAPGACGCGVREDDTDADGTPDCNEVCDLDPNKLMPGACGCGAADDDSDGDGTPDCIDGCPNDPGSTTRGPCGSTMVDPDPPAGDPPAGGGATTGGCAANAGSRTTPWLLVTAGIWLRRRRRSRR